MTSHLQIALISKRFEPPEWDWIHIKDFLKLFPDLTNFRPRRTVFVGGLCDGPDCVVCRLFVCLFKTLSYFWNQTSEFDETLLVWFIGQ